MLTITLDAKPLSINEAFRGRHFPTSEKREFETRMRLTLPKVHLPPAPYYRIDFEFHLKNFALTDYDNLVKVLQDCLVKRGIITDDRLIVDARIKKFPAKKDRIVIFIEGCDIRIA